MTSLTQAKINANTQYLVIGNLSIRQDEDGRYCLNDLHKASGNNKKHQPTNFLRSDQTKELVVEIDTELYDVGNPASCSSNMRSCLKTVNGVGTFAAKELVYAYAMWISAKFHLTVIRAYDAMVMQWQINDRISISPEQQAFLHAIVARRSNGERKIYAEMWARHNRHFKIPRYSELLAVHFSDAVEYLETMVLKSKPETTAIMPIDNNIIALAHNMSWVAAWWRCYSDAFRLINPRMAGQINDHFTDGSFIASAILGRQGMELKLRILQDWPYDLNNYDKINFFRNK